MKTLPMTLAIAAAALCASADSFTYVDHWPSGTGDETATEVVVPDNTTATISTADDVTRVARLTAISLGGSAAKVDYTASSALALAASVSGSGKFSAISSGNLTLSGDNSELESPGCFFFSNTAVTVASRYGLGSTRTATLHYWFGSKVDPFHFTDAGLTNDAPIRIYQGTQDRNCVIGPDNAGETLVFNNDFLFNGSSNEGKNGVFFRNKVRFRAGVFGADSSHPWLHAVDSAEVWFEEDVTVRFYFMFAYNNLRCHLGWSGVSGNRYWFVPYGGTTYGPVVAVCEKDGLFDSFNRGISGSGTIDLNGHDQTIKYLSKTYGSGTMTFTSATPATLSFTKYDDSADFKTSSAKFSGKVNFTYSPPTVTGTGAYTLTGNSALSDSCGNLTVGGAGHLIFANGAGWSGTNVVVQSGATLELNSEVAMTNATATLTVETNGTTTGQLILRSGAACMAKDVTIAGIKLDAGEVYTVAKLRDEMHLPVDGDDLACIVVSGGSSEWHGWPTTPGAVADVPAGLTVYVSDADVATLEALGGINLGLGAVVICTNLTERLDLSAPVSGVGTFQALNSTNIVLSGDNSRLLSPGSFFFSNTAVTVASRYGLGSTGTATIEYFFADKVDPLHFVGAGLTNDVPLRIHQGTVNYNFVLGPTNANETLVIANDITYDGAGGAGRDKYKCISFRNKVRFIAGTFGVTPENMFTYTGVSGDYAEVWFERDAKVNFYFWPSSDNLKLHLDWAAMLGHHYVFGIGFGSTATIAECERDGVLNALYRGISGSGTFDLKGHDQSVGRITKVYGSPTITSATPATFTIVGWQVDADYVTSSMKFTGKVNFTYAPTSADGSYTLTGSAALSTSTGKLTVGGAGQLVFANGAGWCGTNVLIRSSAKLSVASASMPVAFGSRAVLGHSSRTKLEIENGGTLELAASAEPAVVRTLVYNGQIMPAGTYTKTSGVGITGDGVLRVRSSTDGEPGVIFIFR